MAATESEVVEYLNELTWPVSPQMFNALFRASVTVTFELVVFDTRAGALRVLLIRRPDDDTERPGMLHVQGTVMRRGDSPESCLVRLYRELSGLQLTEPDFVEVMDFPMGEGPDECARGQIVQRLYGAYVTGGEIPGDAMLADVTALPIEEFGWKFHRHLIARAREWHNMRR